MSNRKMMRGGIRFLHHALVSCLALAFVDGFIASPTESSSARLLCSESTVLPRPCGVVNDSAATKLFAASSSQTTTARRRELLSRKGPFFKLSRMNGSIEFGATADLVTKLVGLNGGSTQPELVSEWLKDGRGLALSIWDPDLIQDKGDNIYRLQIMTLQFVTLQLSPWVEVQMKTVLNEQQQPLFTLQSVAFDPNIQVLPGMKINAESLGIVIEVSGLLQPGSDGSSVSGVIAFQTTGKLPPPMRILPEPALKAASNTINKTVANFAIQSFQKGAQKNFKDFLSRQP